MRLLRTLEAGTWRFPRVVGFCAGLLAIASSAAACSSQDMAARQGCLSPVQVSGPSEDQGLTPRTIRTVAGSGAFGSEGVGGPATDAQLQTPVDLAFDAAGNMYVAERYSHRILRVDASGTLNVFAGTGEAGFSGDGGPATEAELTGPNGITVGPDGTLYIADTYNNRIRMVDTEGVITTIAGTGEAGFSGDGGTATRAALNRPGGLAAGADGELYIADLGNFRIRMIDQDGTITTVAGTGEAGFSPDGTKAVQGRLGDPDDHVLGLACDAAGTLHLTDLGNSRIRSVDRTGLLQTAAGNGEMDFSGDGGPAIGAGLNQPLDIAFDQDGTLYIATHDHGTPDHRIRMVEAGVITTIAGTGVAGYSGDGGPATAAELNIPAAVAIGPDGNLYIADAINNVIRMVVL